MTTNQIIMLNKILPCIPEDFQRTPTCEPSWCDSCNSVLPEKTNRNFPCIAYVIRKYPLIRTNFYKHYPEFTI